LKNVEEENNKLINKNRELKNELKNCEEKNHDIENTIDSLKGKLKKKNEDYDKLKEELDHKRKESMLRIEKLKNFEKSIEKLETILNK